MVMVWRMKLLIYGYRAVIRGMRADADTAMMMGRGSIRMGMGGRETGGMSELG